MDGDALADELDGEHARRAQDHPLAPARAARAPSRPAVLPRRWLVIGGEALSWELRRAHPSARRRCRILNHYGPTETTVGLRRVRGRAIGAARPRRRCRSAARSRARAPTCSTPARAGAAPASPASSASAAPASPRVPGTGRARRRSASSPIPSPTPGARVYRTGDRVALAARRRDRVPRAARRPGEDPRLPGRARRDRGGAARAIPRSARRPSCARTTTAGERGSSPTSSLAASRPPSRSCGPSSASRLPDYMIPSAFATARRAAAHAERQGRPPRARRISPTVQAKREAEYVAPRDELEEQIAAIWGELLGVEQVGVARRLLRARRALAARDADDHADPPPPRRHPAAGAPRGPDRRRAGRRHPGDRAPPVPAATEVSDRRASALPGQARAARARAPPPPRVGRLARLRSRRRTETGPTPLSFSQQRMWFLDQWEPGAPTFNGARALTDSRPARPGRARGRASRPSSSGTRACGP